MGLKYILTNGQHPDFIFLTDLLDKYYFEKYGDIYLKYQPLNTLTDIHDAVIIYDQNAPVACGGLKQFDHQTAEIKRVFVRKPYRGKHIGKQVMQALETHAAKKGYPYTVLETGADMSIAISLYTKLGYQNIPNFGGFTNDSLCVCMKKRLMTDNEGVL